MRTAVPLFLAAAAAGCSYQAPPPGPPQPSIVDQRAQAKLSQLLAGKVPGPPQSCLANYRQKEMIVVNGNTIAFRDGVNRVWITHPQGSCEMLSSGPYALVTRQIGGLGLCAGDIGEVVDTMSGTTVGSCVMGPFVPYTFPRR